MTYFDAFLNTMVFCITKLMIIATAQLVVVITTVQLYSSKPELWFWTGSNPACEMLEILEITQFKL